MHRIYDNLFFKIVAKKGSFMQQRRRSGRSLNWKGNCDPLSLVLRWAVRKQEEIGYRRMKLKFYTEFYDFLCLRKSLTQMTYNDKGQRWRNLPLLDRILRQMGCNWKSRDIIWRSMRAGVLTGRTIEFQIELTSHSEWIQFDIIDELSPTILFVC